MHLNGQFVLLTGTTVSKHPTMMYFYFRELFIEWWSLYMFETHLWYFVRSRRLWLRPECCKQNACLCASENRNKELSWNTQPSSVCSSSVEMSAIKPWGQCANDNIILFGEEMFSGWVVLGSITRPSWWKLTAETAPRLLSAFRCACLVDDGHWVTSRHCLSSKIFAEIVEIIREIWNLIRLFSCFMLVCFGD